VDNYHLQTRIPTQDNRLNTRIIQTISPKLSARIIYNFSQGANHAFQNFPGIESNTSTRGQSATVGLTQNFTKAGFGHETRGFRGIKPPGFPLSLLGPVGELMFHPQQENPYMAALFGAGELFLVMIETDGLVADDMSNQAGLLVCFPSRHLGWRQTLDRPALW